MRQLFASLPLLFVPGVASAHAFSTGKDAYGAFLEGAGVILATPGLILPLAALAIALVLWRTEGLLAAWPWFLAGQGAGLLLSPLMPPAIAVAPIALGLVVGVLSALVPLGRIGPALPVLAGIMGLSVMLAALEGHGFNDIGIAIRAGLLFAANLAVAVVAGAVRHVSERWPGEVTTIGSRVLASWVAAILVLYLAFSLTA